MITNDPSIEILIADSELPDDPALKWMLLDALTGTVIVSPTSSGVEFVPLAEAYRATFDAPGVGAYVFRWIVDDDPVGAHRVVVVYSGDAPSVEPVPSVKDVGSLLHSRTTNAAGDELGTFTAETRPTADSVSDLIVVALGNVRAKLDNTPCAAVFAELRSATALQAAMLVETSYFPEQVGSDRSPFSRLLELYRESFSGLAARASELCGAGGGDDPIDPETGEPFFAGHTFPPDAGGMVGWGTRF